MSFAQIDAGQSYQGKVVNLSSGGILFTSATALGVGTRLQIVLTPGNPVTPPMQALATVSRVWARQAGYQIACRLDDSGC